jgi:hypothetical protein
VGEYDPVGADEGDDVGLRLADPLVGLSTVADLGFGLTPGEALRSCVLATALAGRLDLPGEQIRTVYYTALPGCSPPASWHGWSRC